MCPALNKHKKFYYVYVLRSINAGRIYVGFTDNLILRLEKHNKKLVQSTKPYAPYELIYFEGYNKISITKDRERKLKYYGQAYRRLKERIVDSLNSAY